MSTVAEALTSGRTEGHPSPDSYVPERLVERIRAEFREMPGLKLTLSQAARIFGLDAHQSKRLLKVLLDEGFLVCEARGTFRRRG